MRLLRRAPLSLLLGLVCVCTEAQAPDATAPTVSAPAGSFVGNSSIGDLDQFLGIPYAKPPVGNLRFANPEPVGALGVEPFAATEYSPGCLQLEAYALYNGLSEDCLTLNVIRPHGEPDRSLPVMFWIHGGGNMNGQSLYYNGTALVQYSVSIDQPIIYVSINYRLGGFGFMNSPDFQGAGLSNVGLKDQHLALQWVQDNIASFGGDPERVTIFGESAGAANCWSQAHHAFTQQESGKYFHAMITQSGAPGSAAFPLALPPSAGLAAYDDLLSQTNCTSAASSIDCLRALPADVLSPFITSAAVTQYTLDNDWFDANLTDLLIANEIASIPIIHGANLDEGSVFLPNFDPFTIPNRTELIAYVSSFLNDSTSLATDVVDAYFSLESQPSELGKGYNADPTAPPEYYPALAVYSDAYMHLGRRALLKNRATAAAAAAASSQNGSGVKIWGYSFEQQPPLSQMNLSYEYPGLSQDFARRVAVQHGAELSYVFGEATSLEGRTQGDVSVSEAMMTAWISMAWTGDPNNATTAGGWADWDRGKHGGHDDDSGTWWPQYGAESEGVVMVFAQQGEQVIGPQRDLRRDGVYRKWNEAREALGLPPIY